MQGPLAITVPGAVRSWGDAHRRFGRLSRDAILAPAIELARDGVPAYPGLVDAIEAMAVVARATSGPDAGFLEVFRPSGRALRPGERLRLPALAATLETLAGEGFDAFYDGDLGERQAATLTAAGSPIRVDDLRSHTSTWGEPIALDYRGVRATSHPPNSSGVVALEILGILAQFEPPPAEAFGPDGVTDARWVHLGIEAAKLAMADRAAHLTDPEAVDVPVARLLDVAYHAELAARIDPRRASVPGASAVPRGGGTIYLATVDADGNAVSLIQSICWHYGSGVVDPATGHRLPEPRRVLQPRRGAGQRPRAAQADPPHAAPRDAVPGPRRRPVDRGRRDGARRATPDPRPVRERRRRRRARHPHGRGGATLVRPAARALRAADRRPPRGAPPTGRGRGPARAGPRRRDSRGVRREPRRASTRSSSSTVVRARPPAPSRRRPTPGATGCPPSGSPGRGAPSLSYTRGRR